jgi:hypothetical protein
MIKWFLIAFPLNLLAVWLLLAPHGACAQSNYRCPGFEPYPPSGCKGPPRCLCDSDGNCRWWFACDEK